MSTLADEYFKQFEAAFYFRFKERPMYASQVGRILVNLGLHPSYGNSRAVRNILQGKGVYGEQLGLHRVDMNMSAFKRGRSSDVWACPGSKVWEYIRDLEMRGQIRPSLASRNITCIDDVFEQGLHRAAQRRLL